MENKSLKKPKLGLTGIVALSSAIGLGGITSCAKTNDKKLIDYNVSKGSYVIFIEKEKSFGVLGNVTLTNDENLLKGRAYNKEKKASKELGEDGRVIYTLPPGEYNISSAKVEVKDFSSKYPLRVVELKEDFEKKVLE